MEAGIDTLKDCGVRVGQRLGAMRDWINYTIPGIHAGFVFLSILRANLQLCNGVGPSTPLIEPVHIAPPPTLSPLSLPSPLNLAMTSTVHGEVNSAEVPELVYEIPRDSNDRVDALKLVADSVAQMRQTVAARMIGSPLVLSILIMIPFLLYFVVFTSLSDWPLILSTAAGLITALLVAIRGLLSGYIEQAEQINWIWLGDGHIYIARFGTNVIGTVVYKLRSNEPSEASANSPSSKSSRRRNGKSVSLPKGKAEIRAWTVRRRERGHGVGKALLDAAVRRCLFDHQCEDVVFVSGEDGDRAGAQAVLSPLLARATNVTKMLDRNEQRAKDCLRQCVSEAKSKR